MNMVFEDAPKGPKAKPERDRRPKPNEKKRPKLHEKLPSPLLYLRPTRDSR